MFSCKDSLTNIRDARKRRQEQQGGSLDNESMLPIDELREQISRKRQRRANTKRVRFDLDATVMVYNNNNKNDNDSSNGDDDTPTWLSAAEFDQILMDMSMTVAGLQNGLIDAACARGLEAYLEPAQQRMDRLVQKRKCVDQILQQQSLLKAMMGKANVQILAKLSTMLSATSVRRAVQMGAQDAEEALCIVQSSAEGEFVASVPTQEPVLNNDMSQQQRLATAVVV